MEFLAEYGLFLAKTATLVVAVLLVAGGIASMSAKLRGQARDEIEIRRLNDRYRDMHRAIESSLLDKRETRKQRRQQKKQDKQASRKGDPRRKRLFVLNFEGDIRASRVHCLREEITAILTIAEPSDEVVIRLESSGGMVHAYGLAASQLDRLRSREIPLTACVDKVAASGGYLMACVAGHVVAAPFAIIGSIGVISQLPNFNKLLKRHDIEFEQITAGEYKRTLTMFGENTDRDRQKMKAEIEQTHHLFKQFVVEHRPDMDIERVATGEYWLGTQAHDIGLVDAIGTSDDLLLAASDTCDILEVTYKPRQNALQRMFRQAAALSSPDAAENPSLPRMVV